MLIIWASLGVHILTVKVIIQTYLAAYTLVLSADVQKHTLKVQLSESGALPNGALKLLKTSIRGDKMCVKVFVFTLHIGVESTFQMRAH